MRITLERTVKTGCCTLLFLAILVLPGPTSAATKTWDGSANGFWSNGANWSGNTAPVAGDILVFPPNAARFTMTNDFSPSRAFDSIQFTGSNYLLRGATLIVSNGIAASAVADTACIVNTDVELRRAQTFSVANANSDIEFHGAFLHPGAHALTVSGAGDTLIASVIDGTGGLTKAGTGELRLAGTLDNTFSGGTIVSEGLLSLGKNSGRLSLPGDVSIGGTAVNSPSATVRLINANQIANAAVVSVGVSSLLDLNGQNETISDLALNSGDVSTGNGVLTLLGDITADATFDDCFVDGQLTLSAGTHSFASPGGQGSRGLRLRAAITGSGALAMESGLIELAGNNTYTGLTTINDGDTIVTSNTGLGSSAAGTVLAGGQVRLIDVAVTGENLTVAVSTGFTEMLASGTCSWSGHVQADITFDLGVSDGSEMTLSGIISGAGGFTKWFSGTLKLFPLGINTYADRTRVEGTMEIWGGSIEGIGTVRSIPGDLLISQGSLVRYASTTSGEAIASAPAVQINTGGLLDLNNKSDDIGPLTMAGDGHIITGTGTLTVRGDIEAFANASTPTATIAGRLALASGRRVFTIHNEGADPRLDISAVVSGTEGLIKAGPGNLRLSGANTFDGPVCVGEGTVTLGNLLALGTTTGNTILSNNTTLDFSVGGTVANESLVFDGVATLRAASGLHTWSGPVTLNAAGNIETVSESTQITLSGAISGPSSLTKIGDGTLQLSGASPNTYRGGTVVLDGTVLLNKTVFDGAIPGVLQVGALAAPPLPFTSNAIVRWLRPDQVTNLFLVTMSGEGFLDLSASSGDEIGGLSGSGAIDLGGAILITGTANLTTTFTGTIGGNGGRLTKAGGERLTLDGTNDYSGETTILGGTLEVNGIQPHSPITIHPAHSLAGTGIVGNVTGLTGDIRPGSRGSGLLTSSNVNLLVNSRYLVELNGPVRGDDYDSLTVRGTVQLNSFSLLNVQSGFAPVEGQQFLIIDNDGTDAISERFHDGNATGNTLNEGDIIRANGLPLRITYLGGSGNDVVLTVDQLALGAGPAAVRTGNADGLVQPNECNTLLLPLTNRVIRTLSGITARLTSPTAGVVITEGNSAYPDIPIGATRTNQTPFQFYTVPDFPCGTVIEFDLIITTPADGTFTLKYFISTPGTGSPRTFVIGRAFSLPDRSTVSAPIAVSGLVGNIGDVDVKLHLTHMALSEVSVSLIAPDGESVLLVPTGLSGTTLGTNCADRGLAGFSDDARAPIESGTPPYVAEFRPASPLSALNGKLASIANGTENVRVRDNLLLLNGTTGVLHCASLTIRQCGDGGGICAPCNGPFFGSITTNDNDALINIGNGSHTTCDSSCPQLSMLVGGHSDVYTFTNGSASNVCVTITVEVPCATELKTFFSSAYLSNPPPAFCFFAGGSGQITNASAVSYSFRVPSNGVFAVWVSGLGNNTCSNYTLRVDGFDCALPLCIQRTGPGRITICWPTHGADAQLECKTNLIGGNFTTVTNQPTASDGNFQLQQDISGTGAFYRLRRP